MNGEVINRVMSSIPHVISAFPQVGQVCAFFGMGDLQALQVLVGTMNLQRTGYMITNTAVNGRGVSCLH